MCSLTLTAAVVLGMAVWVEPSLTNVFPTTPPGKLSEIELRAARGEWESVQVCVRGEEGDTGRVEVSATDLKGAVPAPEIYVVELVTLPQNAGRPLGPLRIPDRLVPNAPQELTSERTISYWLTYKVPRGCRPGKQRGNVRVQTGTNAVDVEVSLEVFGFSIPEFSSLRSFIPLNRAAIAGRLGLPDNALETWAPVYDALAPYRVSFSIWDDPASLPRTEEGSPDTRVLQEHLEYMVQQSSMTAIDIGVGIEGIGPLTTSEPGGLLHPLQLYLYDMGHWLRRHGWFSRALIVPAHPWDRSQWPSAREASFRVQSLEPRLPRLMAAPLHPFFERYLDIWPVSLRDYNYYAVQRLRENLSLKAFNPTDLAWVGASGSGQSAGGYATEPADAVDGSFFTHWVGERGRGSSFPWLQVDFEAPVSTESFEIGWLPGYEAESVRVRVSYDGRTFSNAAVTWSARPAADAFQPSWSTGTFRSPKKIRGIVFEFRDQPAGRPVAIVDMLISPALEERPAPIQGVNMWLRTVAGQFPSLDLPAHPAEPRLVSWVCWSHRLTGVMHAGTAHWAPAWDPSSALPPDGWPIGEMLVYPGDGGIEPSVRLMRLRDGLEDYEYFETLNQMLRAYRVSEGDILELRQHALYPPQPSIESMRGYGDRILEHRDRLATAMNNLLKSD